jgi:type II secretory pathway pseudopilin PulG
MRSGRRQRGVTYLALLFLVAVMGAMLAATGIIWSHERQREKEEELIWIGNQYRQAIGLYYENSPGTIKRYPEKLQDLLEDQRFLTTKRHLRQLYPDPVINSQRWGLVVHPQGGIAGVYSLASEKPIKAAAVQKFVYTPVVQSRTAK